MAKLLHNVEVVEWVRACERSVGLGNAVEFSGGDSSLQRPGNRLRGQGYLRRRGQIILCRRTAGSVRHRHRPQGQGLHDREGWIDSFADCFHRFKGRTRQDGKLFQKILQPERAAKCVDSRQLFLVAARRRTTKPSGADVETERLDVLAREKRCG